jgi:hypothetical protein
VLDNQGKTKNMKSNLYGLFSFLVFFAMPAFGQNDSLNTHYVAADTLGENSKLFEGNELQRISLKFDITKYKKLKSDKEYLDAVLTYHTSVKDSVTKAIKVRSRGEFRRSHCDFPPLMLNFKLKDTIPGEFYKINKLKMVTQCYTGNEEGLLKEYLIYKLYNVLTENSFRVKLLKVDYINTDPRKALKKPISEFAFVIEPIDLLTKRLDAIEVKLTNLNQKKIKPEMMDRVAIFNYMVGNTDWSVPINHNVLILSQVHSERPELGMIVPFDFDFSGLVNADYAAPFPGLKITSVLDRQYMGICRSKEVYINALREFSDKKDEFYKVIKEFPYLKGKTKKEMIIYLDGFFKGIDKRNSTAINMLNDCISF